MFFQKNLMTAASPSGSYSVQCLQMEHLQRLKVVGILMKMQGGLPKLLLPVFVEQPRNQRALYQKRLACKRIVFNWRG